MLQAKRIGRLRWQRLCAVVLGVLLLASAGQEKVWAQQDRNGEDAARKTGPHDDLNGEEMEPKISLAAATISNILRREPGLMLAVKRLLVRQAYERGQLLDPADLTDDALYQLLIVDDNARILATQEIEKREYVRAKPTREEMEKDRIRRLSASELAKLSGATPAAANEEEKYWEEHDQSIPVARAKAPKDGYMPDRAGENDETPPAPSVEQPRNSPRQRFQPASPGYGRQQSMAGMEPPDEDFYDEPPPEADSMPRMSPEGTLGFLNAGTDDTSASQSRPAKQARSFPSASPSYPPHLPDSRAENSDERLEAWARDSSFRSSSSPRENRGPFRQPAEDEDRPVIRHRANPYAGVPSLYDLYAQVSRHAPVLARFGDDIFRNGTGNFDELPMDLPVGPDYVLGPGDGLSIELWGGVSQHLQRVVDREGRVALPEAGAVQVTGRSLGDVQQLVQSVLRGEFRDVHADVSLARLRTVRVYVVGDVLRPGAYDVSSLSTALNALYQAGGPTSRGSLRILRLYRGPQLVGEIDLYDLLLHGVRSRMQRLEAGDTIMVPPVGAELTVEGMVRRPAIYELNHETDLAEALQLAGGVLNTGTLRHIEVERVVAHESRAMLRLDLPENNNQEAITSALEAFKIQDGDKIRISPILPYSEQTVYLDGHVFHPGKRAYREGMRVTDLIHSYADLLPEPAARHAEIIRLVPPDYAPQIIAFNLADALGGNKNKNKDEKAGENNVQNVTLKAFDTVRIFGRYDFEDPPTVMVTGEVRHPGQLVTNGQTRLRDAVYQAGGITRDAQMNDAQVFRRSADGKLKVLSVNLERALAGDAADNVPLEPKDRVFIHRNLAKVDPPAVKIEGEVPRPGRYPLGDDMSAAQLVRLSGGLMRGAFTETADLTRYTVGNGGQIVGEHLAVPLAHALAGDADSDVRLHDGDVLTVRQLAGWTDVGAVITVKGEVLHPGDYGIEEGERLSSVLKRAGGLRADAYPYGAILERKQVRELQEKNRGDLIRQVQAQQSTLQLIPDAGDTDEKLAKSAVIDQWHATLEELKSTPPEGRLVIHISKNVGKWANTPADVEVRAGDTLLMPKTPTYIVVNGQVYNPTAITYRPGKSAGWYLHQAGGPTNMANKKGVFVVRGDGTVVGGKESGEWFTGDVLNAELRPGDMVFVPEKALGGTPRWKSTMDAAQMMSSIAIAISVGRAF
ncbi:MAG: SLBB domain-containing protein [Candidatus Sulfotelmatobacter sp.]